MAIRVSENFDSGNIVVSTGCIVARRLLHLTASWLKTQFFLQVVDTKDPENIQLKIREDPYCKGDDITHFQ